MKHYVYIFKSSNVLQRPAKQLGYQGQSEGDIDLASLGGLIVLMQGVVVVRDLIQRLGLRSEVLGMPDTRLVAVLEPMWARSWM
jgi:hypothetical protein